MLNCSIFNIGTLDHFDVLINQKQSTCQIRNTFLLFCNTIILSIYIPIIKQLIKLKFFYKNIALDYDSDLNSNELTVAWKIKQIEKMPHEEASL